MDPDLPAVLLMGGGEGMGPVKKTAKALAESLFDTKNEKPIGQLVIICGRNKALASSLEAFEWKIPVKVSLKSFFGSFSPSKLSDWYIFLWPWASITSPFLPLLQVRGFEKQMEKWMGACDCIITKVCLCFVS